MTKKDLNGLPVTEMIKCEGCGGYHPLTECEVVVIRIIKGKGCPMPSTSEKVVVTPKVETTVAVPEFIPPPQDKPTRQLPPRKNIIPPGMAAMMIPPTSPHFESHGAKEVRTA